MKFACYLSLVVGALLTVGSLVGMFGLFFNLSSMLSADFVAAVWPFQSQAMSPDKAAALIVGIQVIVLGIGLVLLGAALVLGVRTPAEPLVGDA